MRKASPLKIGKASGIEPEVRLDFSVLAGPETAERHKELAEVVVVARLEASPPLFKGQKRLFQGRLIRPRRQGPALTPEHAEVVPYGRVVERESPGDGGGREPLFTERGDLFAASLDGFGACPMGAPSHTGDSRTPGDRLSNDRETSDLSGSVCQRLTDTRVVRRSGARCVV